MLKIVVTFLSISSNIKFGCSKDSPSNLKYNNHIYLFGSFCRERGSKNLFSMALKFEPCNKLGLRRDLLVKKCGFRTTASNQTVQLLFLLGLALLATDVVCFLPLLCPFISLLHMGLDARKPVFGGLRTTQAQTSLHIRAF